MTVGCGSGSPWRRKYSVITAGCWLMIGALIGIGAGMMIRSTGVASQGNPVSSSDVGDRPVSLDAAASPSNQAEGAGKTETNSTALEASERNAAPTRGLGPRPPTNERERRLAEIPEYNPQTDVVFYSHIHKTSGTSLSIFLSKIFPSASILPSSHPSMGLRLADLMGHDKNWWEPIKVMYSHNRPNVTDAIRVPPTKQPRLLYVIRNPLLHKASIFFESVCRFGRHIKDGKIDQEEATLARMDADPMFSFCRDAAAWLDSPMFFKVYRNMQAKWLSYGSAERHPCIAKNPEMSLWDAKGGAEIEGVDCVALEAEGRDEEIWEEYFNRTADAAIKRMERGMWVGVTERMDEAVCLLLFTLGKAWYPLGNSRHKEPRPISAWSEAAIAKVDRTDRADWRLFDAANEILDLRLWTARERLEHTDQEERERLGQCFDVLAGA